MTVAAHIDFPPALSCCETTLQVRTGIKVPYRYTQVDTTRLSQHNTTFGHSPNIDHSGSKQSGARDRREPSIAPRHGNS